MSEILTASLASPSVGTGGLYPRDLRQFQYCERAGIHRPVRLLCIWSAGHRALSVAVLVVRLQAIQWPCTLHRPFAASAGTDANADMSVNAAAAASMSARMCDLPVFKYCPALIWGARQNSLGGKKFHGAQTQTAAEGPAGLSADEL
jgi:hypothetical protein